MRDWFPANEDDYYRLAQVQLVLFTLGMGLTLSLRDFIEIARRPRSFLVGLAGQLLVVPWIAVLMNWLCNFDPGISIGLILVAAMPGGALSKFFAYLGRGNMALSISLTGVTTLLTLITVPAMLQLLAAKYIPPDFAMPLEPVVIDVALCLLLPLVVGLTVGRLWPARRALLSKIVIRIGMVVVVILVAGSLLSGRIRPLQYGLLAPVMIILFCLIGQQINLLPFRLFDWPRQDRMAVGIEITMRNMNLALLISARLFPLSGIDALGGEVLYVILFYAGAAMGVGLPLALNHRRQARRESLRLAASGV